MAGTSADKLAYLQGTKDAIKAAIAAKGVDVPDGTTFRAYAEKIADISGGGRAVTPKDINFYDYDGTLLEAWSMEDLGSAAALPNNPSHPGLTAQGWNWTLDELKSENRPVHVGQTYITDDGKTRLYIAIPGNAEEGRPPVSRAVPLCISQTVANGVTIDWGDGSAPETLGGTGYVDTTHTYTSAGSYVITLDPAEGCTLGFGRGVTGYSVMGGTGNDGRVFCNMLRHVELGRGVEAITNYGFVGAYSLRSITIPNTVTGVGNYSFNYCYGLAAIVIPASAATIGTQAFCWCYALRTVAFPRDFERIGNFAFYQCYGLANITIPHLTTGDVTGAFQYCYALPKASILGAVTQIWMNAFDSCRALEAVLIRDGVTAIGQNAFSGCYCLASIVVPSTVASIGSKAFQYGYSMKEFHLLPTTPPTLAHTDAFSGIPSDCVFYVPAGSSEAYKTATNWSAYADQIQEEPA